MPNEYEELVFKVKTQRGQRGDGLARVIMETTNPREVRPREAGPHESGGIPGFPPRVPPPPPPRKLVAGYIEEVEQLDKSLRTIRLVLEVEVGGSF